VGDQAVADEIVMLQAMYAAFNRRDIEQVLAQMQDDVDWPNGMEGGRVLGKSAVREYWTRQFQVLDPNVEPKSFAREKDGRIAIDVHQVVRDKSGALVVDQMIQHVYEFRGGLIQRMETREAGQGLKTFYHEGH
jgi:hypothetical protein